MMTRRRLLAGLEEEMRDHIERETQENLERGMSPEEARRAALRKFGNLTRACEQTREIWAHAWLEQFGQDLRYGGRMLWRNPGFMAVAVLTLALGIGMYAAVFSVVNAVLLRPLGYPRAGRLVWIGGYDPHIQRDIVQAQDFYEWRARARSFTAMGAFGFQQAALATARGASQITGVCVAGDFWKITGARAALGRLFGPDETDALVLSWDAFEREFGGDAAAVGRTVALDGRSYRLAGVLPKGFRFEFPMWWLAMQPRAVEMYIPLRSEDAQRGRMVNAVGALRPGVPPTAARAEVATLEQHIRQTRGGAFPLSREYRLVVEPLREKLVGASRPALLVLLAAGAFVLLIGCVNIANLLLVRATARGREIAIRAAVGAGRSGVLRQMLAESLLLAALGCGAGLLLARWALAALVRLAPLAIPRLSETTLDWRVLGVTAAISAGAGVLFGLGPALALWRINLHDALKAGGRGSAGVSGGRLRALLVCGEVALAVVLLTGAGLMGKSLWRMNARPPGFEPARVLNIKLRLAGPQYRLPAAQQAYMGEVVRRVEATPGVEAAGISTWLLWAGAPPFPNDPAPGRTHVIRINAVSPGYPKAIGMRLLSGRWLTAADGPDRILLNQSMAREAFGRRDPLGQQLKVPQPATVVGVVADLQYSKLDAVAPAEIYVRYQQIPMLLGADLAVRAAGDPLALAQELTRRISAIDPTQAIYDVKTLADALADSIAPRRFNLFLMAAFAAAALLLSLVGIYGVIAYAVAERTREIGVRMALGAGRGRVVGVVVRDGMRLAAAGLAAGLLAALALTRFMAGLLYGVAPRDAATFAAVALALAAAALLACAVPALRAALVDPSVTLRYE